MSEQNTLLTGTGTGTSTGVGSLRRIQENSNKYDSCFRWLLTKLEEKQSSKFFYPFYFCMVNGDEPSIGDGIFPMLDIALMPFKFLALPYYFNRRAYYLRDRCIAKIITYCIMDSQKMNSETINSETLFERSASFPKYHKNISGEKNIKTYSFDTLKNNFEKVISAIEKENFTKYDRDILKQNILLVAQAGAGRNDDFDGYKFIRHVIQNTPRKK